MTSLGRENAGQLNFRHNREWLGFSAVAFDVPFHAMAHRAMIGTTTPNELVKPIHPTHMPVVLYPGTMEHGCEDRPGGRRAPL